MSSRAPISIREIFSKFDSFTINVYADYLAEQDAWNAELIRSQVNTDLRVEVGNQDSKLISVRVSGNGLGNEDESPSSWAGLREIDEATGAGFGPGFNPGYGTPETLHYKYGNGAGDGYDGGCRDKNDPEVYKQITVDGLYLLHCQRRWIHVGKCSPNPDDLEQLIVNCCSTVRTTKIAGPLDQLAEQGPNDEIIFDYEGDGILLRRDWIERAIPCNESAWEAYLTMHS